MASLRADYTRRCLICEDSQAETTPEAPQAASLQAEYYPDSAAYHMRCSWLRERLPAQVIEGSTDWMSLAAACRPLMAPCRVFRYEAGQLAPAPVTPRSQCLLDLLDQSSQPAPAPNDTNDSERQ